VCIDINQLLTNVVDLEKYPLNGVKFRAVCKRTLDDNGALVMSNFMKPAAIASIQSEGESHQYLAYYTDNNHNIYLNPPDPQYPADHPRNREVASSKGCITTDQIPDGSVLHTLYGATEFREFLCAVLGETELYEYCDATTETG